jgi:hypothetical protein
MAIISALTGALTASPEKNGMMKELFLADFRGKK